MHPLFLSISDVLYLHDRMIEQHGGQAGIRHLPALETAVMMPQQKLNRSPLFPTLENMAEAYRQQLITLHPFNSANTRTALLAEWSFLELNH